MLTSQPSPLGSKRHATCMPRVTPPVWVNSIRRSSGSGRWIASQRTGIGPRRAPIAKRRSPLAAGHAAHVAVVRQALRPALDLGRQREDPLQRRVDLDRAAGSSWPQHLRQEASARGRRWPAGSRPAPSPAGRRAPAARRGGAARSPSAAARRACPAPARSARPWRRTPAAERPGSAPAPPSSSRSSASAAARAERSAR